jgi:ABC-type nitrate/sulfonate/bicarbonate transport system substrate-binding protein
MRAAYPDPRLHAAAIAVALCAMVGCAAPGQAMDKIRVGAPNAAAFMFTPTEVGIHEGIFKKHGVEVEAIGFEGGAKLQQGMAANSIDLATTGSTDAVFAAKGVSEKAVATFGGAPSSLSIIVRMDGSIKGPADLKGRKIGATTPGSLTEWLAHQFALHQGWGENGIVSVPVGGMGAEISALITKQVDGIVGPAEAGIKLESEGRAKNLVNFGEILPDFVTYLMFATQTAMTDHPGAVKAFIAGWFETVAYMKKNKQDTLKILAGVMKMPPQMAGKIYDLEIDGFTDHGRFDAKKMQWLVSHLVEPKLGGKKVDASTLYTEAFLPK